MFAIFCLFSLINHFAFQIYKIPSLSMLPTIHEGDYILVNKTGFGFNNTKIHNNKKSIRSFIINVCSLKQKKIKSFDVVVFYKPEYSSLEKNFSNFLGQVMVKRCHKIAGETVLINYEQTFDDGIKAYKKKLLESINQKANLDENNEYYKDKYDCSSNENLLFPYDRSLNWLVYKYGPLWIPSEGREILLTKKSAEHYKYLILLEGNKVKISNDSVFLNSHYSEKYTFNNNYYFMLGDNFYESMDSRYWGFVPEKNIIGKAVLVLFSLDPQAKWYQKFRWNRFLKKIE